MFIPASAGGGAVSSLAGSMPQGMSPYGFFPFISGTREVSAERSQGLP